MRCSSMRIPTDNGMGLRPTAAGGSDPHHPEIPLLAQGLPLALRPRDAAKAIGVSERTLWAMTAPRGPVPCVRLGGCTLYPVAALQAWLAAALTKPSKLDEGAAQ
jgi:hypothetical protein